MINILSEGTVFLKYEGVTKGNSDAYVLGRIPFFFLTLGWFDRLVVLPAEVTPYTVYLT